MMFNRFNDISVEKNFSNPEFLRFIEANINIEPSALRLKYHNKDLGFDSELAITQIECRRKAASKLSEFISTGCFFPDLLAAEQASNQEVSKYHAQMVSQKSRVVDLTAGLGIDFMEMSAVSNLRCTAIEINPVKAASLSWNCNHRKLMNTTVICDDALHYISELPLNTTVFIDPARRANDNSRIFDIAKCMPDITAIAPDIMKRAERLIVKTSPMIDISQTIRQFPVPLSEIHVVDMKGECKEVLLLIDKDFMNNKIGNKAIKFKAVELSNETPPKIFEYSKDVYNESGDYILNDSNNNIPFCTTSDDIKENNWLYHPSSALMKLSPWNHLIERYPQMRKISSSTHLFIADKYYEDFPGRKLLIKKIITSRDLKKLKGSSLNVVSRNYPQSAEQLEKRLSLKGSDNNFLYAFRRANSPMLLLCSRQ